MSRIKMEKSKRVSVSIMMHPSRKKYLPYLKKKLGNVPVAMATDASIWNTCKKAWLLFDPKAEYHFVIQDDAIIGKNFYEHVEGLISNGSEYVYNLYLGKPRFRSAVKRAKDKKKGYIRKSNIHHEIALGFPTKHIEKMVKYVDQINTAENINHDKTINRYVRENNMVVFFPLPSLIDHRAEESLHTMNRGHYKAKALWFIGE